MKQVLAYVTLLMATAAQAQVAIVTDLAGRAGTLAILSEIPLDSTVKLEGELTVLYYASGDEFRMRGPALIAFGPNEPKVLQGAVPQRRAAEAKRGALKPGGVVPATFVMRGGIAPELRARVDAARPAPDAPVAERVAFAAWLEQMQLGSEARPYWQALAAERPESERLRELARQETK